MDLSSPLRSLIPSLDSAVLEVLAGTESSVSIAQLTRLASHGSRAGLTLALERLVEHGLVTAIPANRGSMYRLNTQHVLAEAVANAAKARLTVLARLEENVGRMHPEPAHASVFGSFARREAGIDSDIDVLFVLSEEADDAWYEQVRELADLVYSCTGNRMEYLVFSLAAFAGVVRREEPIVDSWIADSVTIHGPAVELLVRDTSTAARLAGQ